MGKLCKSVNTINVYPYHNRIIQRIRNGECTGVSPSENPEFAFVLTFSTPPFTRPIRPHAAGRYLDLPELELQFQYVFESCEEDPQ